MRRFPHPFPTALALAGGLALCAPHAWAATESFNTAGGGSWTVPAGVTEITVRVAGAGGGAGPGYEITGEYGDPLEVRGKQPGGTGGRGALVEAKIQVQPGDVVGYVVAGSGAGGGYGDWSFGDGSTGNAGEGGMGAGAGGSAYDTGSALHGANRTAGGGGGASAVSVGSSVVRAGGGGGGGGRFHSQTYTNKTPGNGGDALAPASPSSTADCSTEHSGEDGLMPAVDPDGSVSSWDTGSGAGGGGGYQGSYGLGGATVGYYTLLGFPLGDIDVAPGGGSGGGSCYFSDGTHPVSGVMMSVAGGEGGQIDPDALPNLWARGGYVAADGADGWITIEYNVDTGGGVTPSHVAPVPATSTSGLVFLAALMGGIFAWRRRDARRTG